MNKLSLGDVSLQFYVNEDQLIRKSTGKEAGGFRKDGYRTVSIFNNRFLVHRILYMLYHQLDCTDLPKFIDHIDGDNTNNSKDNLRGCESNRHNLMNCKPQNGSSKYRGVRWHKSMNKWTSQIMSKRKSIYLGSFVDEEEAALAYNKAATKHFGEYARLNIVNDIR